MIAEDNTIKEDDCLVRVKAQVMTRDESTGGWVPLGRGGMSVVGLRRLITATGEDVTTEYRLHGQRIADQSVVLNCPLKKDLQYTKANPTFHHWWTGNKRFGLTFQSSADARVLERSVCKAMEAILTPPSCSGVDGQITDDDVFMALNLPMGKDDSWCHSISTTSTETSSPSVPLSPSEVIDGATATSDCVYRARPPSRAPLLHQSTVGSSADDDYDGGEVRLNRDSFQLASTSVNVSGDVVDIEMVDYSYVKLAKTCTTPKHDYTYPTVDSPPAPPIRSEPSVSVESSHPSYSLDDTPPPAVLLPVRKQRSRSVTRDIFRRSTTLSSERPLVSGMRSRCVYCHEMFTHANNRPGSCIDAPDPARRLIDRVSCLCCARAVVYHCHAAGGASADDWRSDDEPCTGCDPSAPGCCSRWTLLAALALVVPCLWCYLPLSACHHCVRWCGHCGGRHKAA